MKIIHCNAINQKLYTKYVIIDGMSFTDREDCQLVIDAANSNIETIKKWFDIIGIKYSNIKIVSSYAIYTVGDNKDLMLADLSSGERLLLYILACKTLNKQNLLVQSLFERLGTRLTDVCYDIIRDYEDLTVVYYSKLPVIFKEFEVDAI